MDKQYKIAVIGQGYVGLPLALAFSKYFPVIGYDINQDRITNLKEGIDLTKEANVEDLEQGLINFTESNGTIFLYLIK